MMNIKLIGAVMVIISCGCCGFYMASTYKNEEKMYRLLLRLIQNMKCELEYRLTSLPELCEQAAEIGGMLGDIFCELSNELKTQLMPDVSSCMRTVLQKERNLPTSLKTVLMNLGSILGRYDLDGQVEGFEAVSNECKLMLERLNDHRDERLRGYQTLGLCAGAALVVLFI